MTRKVYKGGCQCGKVQYEVTLEPETALACNCSRCRRLGWLFTFVPSADFKILSGDDALTDFMFNRHTIHHLFCKICGIESFARGTGPDGIERVAINLRCVDDFDTESVDIKNVDGASRKTSDAWVRRADCFSVLPDRVRSALSGG